jgi:PAS domain S-box-containing protein
MSATMPDQQGPWLDRGKDMKAAPRSLAIALLTVSALAAAAGAYFQDRSNTVTRETRFSAHLHELSDFVRERMALYEYGLRGARGAIVVGGGRDASREDFDNYFRTRDQLEEFPGSRGVGYIERVEQDRVDAFVAAARADGFPDFDLRELSQNEAERFIIKYIYPLEGNEGATGLDIGSEGNRRRAALEAARSGKAGITEPITLVQASGEVNAGFLILLPIYASGADTSSETGRLEGAIGWSYSPIVVTEVLDELGLRRDEIAFAISDAGSASPFYATGNYAPALSEASLDIQLYGRTWRISSHPVPETGSIGLQQNPWFVFALILFCGILIAGSTYGLASIRERQSALRRRSTHLMESIVQGAPMALLVLDRDKRIVRANEQAIEMFDCSDTYLDGKLLDDLVQKSSVASDLAISGQADPSDDMVATPLASVYFAERQDGSQVPVVMKVSTNVLPEDGGSIAGILDFSTQMEAYRVLAESELRWQDMANRLPHLVWTSDAKGEFDFLSLQWESYTGAGVGDLAGLRWLDLVHPDDRETLEYSWLSATSIARSFSAEFRLRRHDGVFRRFYLLADPVIGKAGVIERWVGSNTDFEDRYQAEREVHALLREMELRVAERTAELDDTLHDLNNILNAVQSPIGYWDRNQINRIANKAHKEWYGIDPEWLKGRHARELLGEELYEANAERIAAVLRGEPQQWERDMVDAAGVPRVAQVNFLPDVRNGEIEGYYVILFDITEVKASEAAQKEARKVAELATRAKSAFLTSMSHELRTPMNSILGFSDLMLSEHFGALNEKQLVYARMIRDSGEHLLKLMDSVLELSKIEAGRVSVSIEPVNVVAAIRAVLATLEPLAENRKVEIRKLKSIPGDLFVDVDQTRLTQILTNLGSNAIKYNRSGGWMSFGCEVTEDEMVRISVTDNGIGIPEDRQAGAFQPFNRMGAEQGEIEGTGIGLALVKNFIELMGGRIDFTSREGEGSCFWIDIPMADMEVASGGEDPSEVISPVHADGEGEVSVLYVEDNQINRELFRNYVEMIGNVSLSEAHNGVEGLRLARQRKPDIIFLDINLPGLDGYEVIKALRANPETAGITVVALTANAMAGDADKGLQAGFDRYLAKPVRLSSIQDVIAAFRRGHPDGRKVDDLG